MITHIYIYTYVYTVYIHAYYYICRDRETEMGELAYVVFEREGCIIVHTHEVHVCKAPVKTWAQRVLRQCVQVST